MSPKKPPILERPVRSFFRAYFIWLIIILIAIVCAGAYLLGYRLGPGVTLSRVGTLTLTNVPAGASIYIDQILRSTPTATSTQNIDLVSGNHTVIVSALGDYPWNDLVAISSGKTSTLHPIFISTQPHVTQLTGTAKTDALAHIASTTLPTQTTPIILANGCADVYVANNQIVADATTTPGCTPPPYLCLSGTCASTIIFAPVDKLSAVFPFPGRQDALIVGLDNVLYAIALDPRSPQFFAPVLGATNPMFGVLSDGSLVVENGGVVLGIKL